jgi:hypothetical protein
MCKNSATLNPDSAHQPVIPAKAGIHSICPAVIPAKAGIHFDFMALIINSNYKL